MDIVLLARQGAGRLDNAELSSILRQLWQKLVRRYADTVPSINQDS